MTERICEECYKVVGSSSDYVAHKAEKHSDEMKKTTYYSECECGQEVEGEGEYHPEEGTLYGEPCPKCGEDFIVMNWFWRCENCQECHEEGRCEV